MINKTLSFYQKDFHDVSKHLLKLETAFHRLLPKALHVAVGLQA